MIQESNADRTVWRVITVIANVGGTGKYHMDVVRVDIRGS